MRLTSGQLRRIIQEALVDGDRGAPGSEWASVADQVVANHFDILGDLPESFELEYGEQAHELVVSEFEEALSEAAERARTAIADLYRNVSGGRDPYADT